LPNRPSVPLIDAEPGGVPRLMTDEELAAVFEAFVKEVRGRPPKAPAEPPEPPKGSPLPPHRYPKKRR
jgi:hypothetical protein